MPIIYAATTDSFLQSAASTTWSSERDAEQAQAVADPTLKLLPAAASVFRFSGRGADIYRVHRTFFHFDTSSITATVSAAGLDLTMPVVSGDSNVIVLASDAFTGNSDSLQKVDFNNLDFSTPYSSEVDNSAGGTITITLNAAALAVIKSSDDFKIAVVNYDYDYNNTPPTSGNNHTTQMKTADDDTDSQKPLINYTLATGYGNIVNGVATANIGKVDGVATANIEKVIGV